MSVPRNRGKPRTDFTRLDWQRREIGRLTVASGAKNRKVWDARQGLLTKLYDAGQYDTLRALKAGMITVRELVAADRAGRLLRADLLADIHLRAPLWATLESTIAKLGRRDSTRREYRSVLAGFAKRGVLPKDAVVGDLLRVEWRRDVRGLYGTPANWNHLFRLLSACLSTILGDRYHPARRQFVAAFGGLEKEPKGKVVTLTAKQAVGIIAALPEVVRPAVAVLMATGVRIGEYVGAGRDSYDAETGQWIVTGKAGTRTVVVPASARPFVSQALPWPWGYRTLYNHIKRAAAAIGKPALTPHDLRHAATVWALAAGASLEDARDMLGHDDIQTTGRYARSAGQERTSRIMDRALRDVLGPASRTPAPLARPSAGGRPRKASSTQSSASASTRRVRATRSAPTYTTRKGA